MLSMMKMLLRFRVKRPFQIGRKFFNSGFVTLSQVFPQASSLLALGNIEEVKLDDSLSDYVVVLKESVLGELGEVIQVDDLPQSLDKLEKFCFVLRLYDAELNEVHTCRDCGKSFFGQPQAMAHKKRTGHRLRRRGKETLDEPEAPSQDLSL